jgi:hypothetical protein
VLESCKPRVWEDCERGCVGCVVPLWPIMQRLGGSPGRVHTCVYVCVARLHRIRRTELLLTCAGSVVNCLHQPTIDTVRRSH